MKKAEVLEIIEPKNIYTGPKDAPITLVEFGDYESDECAKANEIVKQILEAYPEKVKFIFRHFPLLKFHQKAHKAAEAAIAAGQEGKFWDMHQAIFLYRRNLGVTSLKLYAREVGVKNKKFLDELINGMYGWHVQGDLQEGQKLGVVKVPAFFINGERFEEQPTFKNLSARIETLLRSKKPKAKTPAKASVKTVKPEAATAVKAVKTVKPVKTVKSATISRATKRA
jgi:protein-disulfide isomerase